jgi:hypothetical protein
MTDVGKDGINMTATVKGAIYKEVEEVETGGKRWT